MSRILIPLLLLLSNAYVLLRIWQILPVGTAWKIAVLGVWLLCLCGVYAGFSNAWSRLPLPLGTAAYEISNTWMIVFLYALIAFVLLDLGRLVRLVPADFLKASAEGSVAVFGVIAVVLLAGNIHYKHKYREEIDIATPKLSAPVTVVLASDLHVGYHNRRKELARWIDLINAEQPDLVLLGGDIIDRDLGPVLAGDYAAEFRRLRAPVYTCPGNHEYYSGMPEAEQFLRDAGIHLLRDAQATCCGLRVIGRDDRTNSSRAPLERLAGSQPDAPYTLLLDHQPYHLEEAEAAGIDFQFSGHTHRGQVWPVSWVTDLMYEKAWGRHSRGGTQYYVSSGLGIWGAKIRIGTRSEYLVLHLHP